MKPGTIVAPHSNLRTRFALLAAALALLLAAAGAGAIEGPFWKVSGRAGAAYLLGSVHFGTDAIYPLDRAIEDAFARSDRLAVEVDLQSVDNHALMVWITEHGAFTDGSSLSDKLPPGTWKLLRRRADQFQVPVGAFAFQRPWLAAFSMTALALTRNGFREELGIDRHFLLRASGKKPVVELESVQEQMGLLAGLPPEVEAHFLHMTLENLADGQDAFERLFKAWKSGDAGAIEAQTDEMRRGPYGQVLYSRLIEERNEKMALRISELLGDGGTTFVVVGAAHLVGHNGVAARLGSLGYRVERR